MTTSITLWRDDAGLACCSIPHSIVEHSPSGFSWGDDSEGAAELALNILARAIPAGSDNLPTVSCSRGVVSQSAYRLHQRFKDDVLGKLPGAGGKIRIQDVLEWAEKERSHA